jgi:uncharacterized protein (TIGR04255 family)
VGTGGAIPAREEEIWEIVGSLRSKKNQIFESCITDETRKLFQ